MKIVLTALFNNLLNIIIMLDNILNKIIVKNWYLGEITAFYAWSNSATIEKKDCAKVRRILKKHGYKCSICGGIIGEIWYL